MANKIKNLSATLLNRSWTTLQKFTFELETSPGIWEQQVREAYDRGNGVCALLYNTDKMTILLVKQFRLPTYLNGNSDGTLLEVCAGKLSSEEDPLEGIRREVFEELGHGSLQFEKVLEAYMSPGSVTEMIHFYLAEYSSTTRLSEGGGLKEEQENIEVIELPIKHLSQMISSGEIKDAKTIILIQHLHTKLQSRKEKS